MNRDVLIVIAIALTLVALVVTKIYWDGRSTGNIDPAVAQHIQRLESELERTTQVCRIDKGQIVRGDNFTNLDCSKYRDAVMKAASAQLNALFCWVFDPCFSQTTSHE